MEGDGGTAQWEALAERYPLPADVADVVMNKSQLARALQKSEPTIDRWIGDGMPVLAQGTNGRSYEFQLSHCFAWWQARMADERATSAHAERVIQQLRLALIGGVVGDTERALPPKERREIYAAETAYMQMARDRGELVRFDEMVEVIDGALSRVRSAIEMMPDRLAREANLSRDQVQAAIVVGDDVLDDLRASLQSFVAGIRARHDRATHDKRALAKVDAG